VLVLQQRDELQATQEQGLELGGETEVLQLPSAWLEVPARPGLRARSGRMIRLAPAPAYRVPVRTPRATMNGQIA
jgi:hypothetical protein